MNSYIVTLETLSLFPCYVSESSMFQICFINKKNVIYS